MARFIQLDENRLLNLDTVFEVQYVSPIDTPPVGRMASIAFQTVGGQMAVAYRARAVSLWGQLLADLENPMPDDEPITGTG